MLLIKFTKTQIFCEIVADIELHYIPFKTVYHLHVKQYLPVLQLSIQMYFSRTYYYISRGFYKYYFLSLKVV